MKCIGCGEEVITGFELQGVGMLCDLGSCYAMFIKKREKYLAKECWGNQAKV